MAIAFDASSIRTQDSGGGTTSTWSHTCTGSDRILFVGVTVGTGMTVSGVTYNGVSMTQVATLALGGAVFNNGYIFRLVAPATGANNIVVTASADTFIYAAATSYTGVDQTTPIDVSGTNSTTGTSLGLSLTTTKDNDWLVGFWYYGSSDDDFTAGSNTLIRQEDAPAGIWYAMAVTNSAQTPAGSKTITLTSANSRLQGVVGAAFMPVQSSVQPAIFMGCNF